MEQEYNLAVLLRHKFKQVALEVLVCFAECLDAVVWVGLVRDSMGVEGFDVVCFLYEIGLVTLRELLDRIRLGAVEFPFLFAVDEERVLIGINQCFDHVLQH
jgi:hypothetical protein